MYTWGPSPPPSPGLYDGYPYHEYIVEVRLSDGRLIDIHFPAVQDLIPRLDEVVDSFERIDLARLAHGIARRVHKSLGANRDSVHRCLSRLFRILWHSYWQPELFGSRITGYLEQRLIADHSSRSFITGLIRARRSFVILSQMAKTMDSNPLASALVSFFLLHRDIIIEREDAKYLGAWGLAFMDIQALLSKYEALSCFRALADRLDDIRHSARYVRYHDFRWNEMLRIMAETLAWDLEYLDDRDLRGRRLRRSLLYHAPKARTMPPPIIHHRAPAYIMAAPSPSMELIPAVDPEYVVENLVDLQDRVADLERDRDLSVPLRMWPPPQRKFLAGVPSMF